MTIFSFLNFSVQSEIIYLLTLQFQSLWLPYSYTAGIILVLYHWYTVYKFYQPFYAHHLHIYILRVIAPFGTAKLYESSPIYIVLVYF